MNTSFGAILDRPTSEIERPKPIPTGTYLCIVEGLPRFDKSSKKQTEFVEFTLRPLSAEDDVDKDSLEEQGGLGDRIIKATFYLTEDAAWRLKKFLHDDLLLPEQETLRPVIDETPGQQVLVFIKHEPSQDGTQVFARVASTAPVPTA